jgi:glycosyltransferase involved in cell wall biosynthesis
MTMTPMVSIIMAAYNAEKYISESIDSILFQTYKNFEFIIIDDGSTDSTWDIISKYSIIDNRILSYRQSNLGLTKSLNIAISLSKGKYIARQDADDISIYNRIECQVKLSSYYNVILSRAYKNNKIVPNQILNYFNYESLILTGNIFIHGSLFIESSILKKYLYDEEFIYVQDYNLLVRLILDKIPIFIMRCPYYILRTHLSQISNVKKNEQNYYLMLTFKNFNLDDRYIKILISLKESFYKNLIRLFFILLISVKTKGNIWKK